MASEGLIDEEEAVLRVDPAALDQLLHPTLDPDGRARRASPRACPPRPAPPAARSCSTPTPPRSWRGAGEKVILVRVETSPEDIHGMHAAKGILTARGGMTSHAAVVARGMGRPCVSGAGAICDRLPRRGLLRVGGHEVREGDIDHASTARPAR